MAVDLADLAQRVAALEAAPQVATLQPNVLGVSPAGIIGGPLGGPTIQYVDNQHPDASDTNLGLTFGLPKATIESAVGSLPDGGIVLVAPGQYNPRSKIQLDGHLIQGMTFTGAKVAKNTCLVQHNFDDDLFEFVAGAQGGGLRNLYLNNNSNHHGRAIWAHSSAADGGAGYMTFENLVVNGNFDYDVYLDGADCVVPQGIRDIFFNNCLFFGCQTEFNTVVVNGGVHIYFVSCDVIQAPSALTQGVNLSTSSGGISCEDIFWFGKVLGNWFTQANGGSGPGGCLFIGRISGEITCDVGSQNNVFYGLLNSGVSGLFTNNGVASGIDANLFFGSIPQPAPYLQLANTQLLELAGGKTTIPGGASSGSVTIAHGLGRVPAYAQATQYTGPPGIATGLAVLQIRDDLTDNTHLVIEATSITGGAFGAAVGVEWLAIG